MQKTFLAIGAVMAGLGVILGAFGAHGLKKIAPPETIATFQTGVQYQMYHAFALLFTGILFERFASSQLTWAGWCFVVGTVLFSGSLYALTVFKARGVVGLSAVGAITPFGGLFFIAGWVLLLIGMLRR